MSYRVGLVNSTYPGSFDDSGAMEIPARRARPPVSPAYLTAKEAAIYLSISASSLDNLVAAKEIRKFHVLARSVRYKVSDLDGYMDRQSRRPR